MDKRLFLGATAAGALVLPWSAGAAQTPKGAKGPALLTVTGAVGKPNRDGLDPVLDQMMAKQKLAFENARAFDFSALVGLPAITVRPTLEYDSKVHTLKGPLLTDIASAAGAPSTGTRFVLRAIDGYNVTLSLADARKYRFIIATHLDGQPMPLGGLGPLWAVYDADRFADMAAKPVADRFAQCPWGLFHMEVFVG